ncbi:dTDP-4-dehydrorhamnose 3,5-epimerase [Cohnella suwonensis]|uniref:dTDP-4-dehydrorhamnose 3,5-epimerase n=1 Tax=Cohnella suwonensis TaxID=696072 RepID=A0ABW0LXQ6_9BACL
MNFKEISLNGVFVIEIDPIEDERGFFARSWCKEEFIEHGVHLDFVQCNISYNKKKGTLRGMHFQAKPYEEAKLVRCTRGAIYDVIIDLRPDSNTFKRWAAVELTSENRKMLLVPAGFAHGFQTLEDDTEVFYHMSEYYHSESAGGIRWDDPVFKMKWPLIDPIISCKDKEYPNFK